MTVTVSYGLDLDKVNHKFEWKRQQAARRKLSLFSIFELSLTDEEQLLLRFLYAYMPLHDLADYDGEYFLRHVRHALHVRSQMPWGASVPDEIFVHFVLPYRVNNENIDNSSQIIYSELVDRVRNLPMTEAVLETNYWCHERATYVGTDIRTVSPLTIMRTAQGRCGEQSTLAVTALRSIGIPARQCYTPRWAHCDSNHAWVETWADGQWHYLGACEPEPVLDEGWFRLPARRAMLVNTRVSADYTGPEEVCSRHPWYTEINMLKRYAPVHPLTVHTVDEQERPISAEVQFQLYNAAEFSPLATMKSDSTGRAQLTTGYGDLLIHARAGQRWGETWCRGDQSEVTVSLGLSSFAEGSIDWKMTAPVAPPVDEGQAVSPEDKHKHEQRIQEGIALRTAYEAGFLNREESAQLAAKWQLPAERIWKVLETARGNSRELADFLEKTVSEERSLALRLLESMRPKDWQDTFEPVLQDHLNGSKVYATLEEAERERFDRYVLCPRIHFEMLSEYRAYFQSLWSLDKQEDYRRHPQQLAADLEAEVRIYNQVDRYSGMATPAGAHQLGVMDALSRDMMFVAAARSLGIPARLEPLQLQPQYWQHGGWTEVQFTPHLEADEVDGYRSTGIAEDAANDIQNIRPEPEHTAEFTSVSSGKGKVIFRLAAASADEEAGYYRNFTLARLEDGAYRTVHFPYGEKEMCDKPYDVIPGAYRLTTGTRLSDGSVEGRFMHFHVYPEQTTKAELLFRSEQHTVPLIHSSLPDQVKSILSGNEAESVAHPAGCIITWLEPEREPTKHLLRELSERESEWSAWGGPVYVLTSTLQDQERIATDLLSGQIHLRVDQNLNMLSGLKETMQQIRGEQRPIVLVVDPYQNIRYAQQGYKLGTGSDLLQVLEQLAAPHE
ncbi:transglutaminase-like domain-containing protein [Paenibacillus shenyangensis]|uniref:transglutaminase-like domain-containing protein n=1 Tax=Paenibacillus sp. A9 TaxID=1284352 RepID=UPI00036381ED|nr:transglutaminase-like domain-containing protein [Paenibacillus sp. A9]